MVDVSAKDETQRWAIAEARLCMQLATLDLIMQGGLPKGDVLTVARLAGIQAAKKTSDLIPLCHPLALTSIDVEIKEDRELPGLLLTARCGLVGRTGVEMEALTAVSLAALTVYDMCKAVDRSMHMT
ncbi:MAG: cyclic pyranopterin monophosphate synthase MoaC, partial [Pseudomonadales bacterium]|nr:cyclic pyranopterin monophosphate synthase MoaC [Pseudomonadales bacterium]